MVKYCANSELIIEGLKKGTLSVIMACFAAVAFSATPISSKFESGLSVEVNVASQLTLSAPANGLFLNAGARPLFSWQVTPQAPNSAFKLRVVEVTAGQSAANAFGTNKPFFEKDTLNALSMQYPLVAPMFNAGQTYAWSVSYNGVYGEVRTFSVRVPIITSFSPLRGPVGTIVTVTGTGLTGPSDIIVGGSKNAQTLTNTATQITAKLLPVNTSGSVKVRVPGGYIARASGLFTVTDTTKLSLPANLARLNAGVKPTFSWTIPSPATGDVFKIKIVEITSGQSPTAAFRTNKPFFEKDSLNALSIQYPSSAPIFNAGQSYAWAVSYHGFYGEVRTFSIKPPVITSFSPLRGPVGTIIMVTGTGLTGPSDVIVGGSKNAQTLTNTSTQITAKLLPVNTSGSVKVRVPGGFIARAGSLFTVTDTTKLSLPANLARLNAGVKPTFSWTIPSATAGDVFKIRIVEVISGQSAAAAFRINKPFFEKDSLKELSIQYPSTAPSFNAGQSYAWAVSYNGFYGEVRSFSIQSVAVLSFSPASGPVGTIVTITGTGLAGPVDVLIGERNALLLSSSNTQATAMIMPANATGSVKVRTPSSSIAAASGNFTITPTLFPNVQQGSKMADTAKYFDPANYVATSEITSYVRKSNIFQQGYSVALSADGNTAIASARVGEIVQGRGYGCVIFYERQNGIWKQSGRPRFYSAGNKVALSADGTVAVAPNSFAFFKVNGVWTDGTALGLGGSNAVISADGNTIVTASSEFQTSGYYAGTYRSAATVGHRETDNFVRQTAQLKSTADGYFPGHAIAISADAKTIAAVIARPSPKNFSTLIYKQIDTAWVIQQELPASGNDVALNADGSVLLVSDAAAGASIYTLTGTLWSAKQKLTETGKGAITADGNTMMFTAATAPVVYSRNSTGLWVKQNASFGTSPGLSVALSADGTTGLLGDTRDTSMIPTQNPVPYLPAPVGGPQSLGAVYAFEAGVPITPPALPATALTFTNTTTNSTTLSWTKGSGNRRAVFISAGITGYPALFDGAFYTANAAFGASPASTFSSWYCVYNGDGTSVNITGLTQGASFIVAVVDYNGDNGAQKYGPQLGNTAVVTTRALNIQASKLTFSNSSSAGTSVTANWVIGSGLGRAVFVSKGNSGVPLPANVNYTANSTFGSGQQIGNSGWYCVYYSGSSTVVNTTITGLVAGQTYRVAVIDCNYNQMEGHVEFIPNDIVPANITMQVAPPTGYAVNLAFSNTTAQSTTLSWTNSNGSARAVFLRAASTGAPAIVQGTTYNANSTFGLGTQVGTNGWYCVYNGTGSSVNISGLNASTTYRSIVLEYNGPAGNEAYNLSRYNQLNVITQATSAAGVMFTENYKNMLVEQDELADYNAPELNIHQGLSPNADGQNDVFTIDGIGAYPRNTVKIMNSNGDVVYSVNGYNNHSRVFDGHAADGTLQKAGTYFYSLEYMKGAETIRKTGYLVIKY